MSNSNANSFIDYVSSIISLDALEKMTDDMDQDIAESQKLMDRIKNVFDSLPSQSRPQADNGASGMRHEDVLSNFLESDDPNLVLPDMATDNLLCGDLHDIIATMKSYAEDLKNSYKESGPKMVTPDKDLSDLELDQCAFSLHQLGKRLANIKLNQKEEVNKRNPELEEKLTQLCEDVNNFTQMVQAKTRLTEVNKNWSEPIQDNRELQYNEIITKLLSGINEVIYLLQNKN